MNKEVTKILTEKLINTDLNFVDLIGGLVQRVEKEESGKRLFFPVAWNIKNNKGEDLESAAILPDQNLKGFIFFEENGNILNIGTDSRGNLKFKSNLNLICWLNKNKITGTNKSISARAQSIILNSLDLDSNTNEGIFYNFKVNLEAIQQTDASIFSKYTFNEARTQYITPPFEYFCIKLSVNYTLSKCINPIELNPNLCL